MTYEITILPISCRTVHKIKKILWTAFINISLWCSLIFGILMVLIPKYLAEFVGNYKYSDYDMLIGRIGGGFVVVGTILLMTVIYDVKIHWCKKEKSE